MAIVKASMEGRAMIERTRVSESARIQRELKGLLEEAELHLADVNDFVAKT